MEQLQKLEGLLERVRRNASALVAERSAGLSPLAVEEESALELNAEDILLSSTPNTDLEVTTLDVAADEAAHRDAIATSFEHPIVTDGDVQAARAQAAFGASVEEEDAGPLSQRSSGTEWTAAEEPEPPHSGVPGYVEEELSAEEEETMPASSEMEEVDGIDGASSIEQEGRTPPPESGPIVSTPPLRIEMPEPELDIGAPVSMPGSVPTMAQLGTTVELEGDSDPSRLELHRTTVGPPEPSEQDALQPDGLEEVLPVGTFAAAYDASLRPPAQAQEELRAHDAAQAERQRQHEARHESVSESGAYSDLGLRSEPDAVGSSRPSAAESTSATGAGARIEAALPTGFEPTIVIPSPVAEMSFGQLLLDALKLGQ